MSKTITQEQIKAVLKAFYDANAGVQVYGALQKLFEELPDAETNGDEADSGN